MSPVHYDPFQDKELAAGNRNDELEKFRKQIVKHAEVQPAREKMGTYTAENLRNLLVQEAMVVGLRARAEGTPIAGGLEALAVDWAVTVAVEEWQKRYPKARKSWVTMQDADFETWAAWRVSEHGYLDIRVGQLRARPRVALGKMKERRVACTYPGTDFRGLGPVSVVIPDVSVLPDPETWLTYRMMLLSGLSPEAALAGTSDVHSAMLEDDPPVEAVEALPEVTSAHAIPTRRSPADGRGASKGA